MKLRGSLFCYPTNGKKEKERKERTNFSILEVLGKMGFGFPSARQIATTILSFPTYIRLTRVTRPTTNQKALLFHSLFCRLEADSKRGQKKRKLVEREREREALFGLDWCNVS